MEITQHLSAISFSSLSEKANDSCIQDDFTVPHACFYTISSKMRLFDGLTTAISVCFGELFIQFFGKHLTNTKNSSFQQKKKQIKILS